LDNRNGEAFTDKPFFNESFVKENKLKQLTGTYVYKKTGEAMKTTTFKYVYNFDREGHLVSTYETKKDEGAKDTLWNIYSYDANNHLAFHRKTDLEGFTTVHYTYDDQGRVIAEEFKRDIDSLGKIVRSLSFNKEKIVYSAYDDQLKKTRYNNYDLPYLDEFVKHDSLGYLIERTERVKMTSTIYTYAYEYNEHGKLSAIRKSSNREEGYIEEWTFRYDELGNLIEKHIYKNGVFTTDIQIIYNSKTKLLATVITKQVSTGFLIILRFQDYEFYD
jgi:YD repeat-containing protein